MMKSIFILTIILYLTQLFGQTEKLIYNQLIKPADAEFYHVPVGLCEDYPEETTTPEIIRGDFEFLKQHDVNLLRISFGWDAIESVKDTYDWLFWDDYVKMAVEEYNITLVPYICYTPQWISRGKTDTLFFWNYPAEDFEQFGKFMEQLVNRYKKYIKTWELWNEPDISIYWQGTNKEFAEFIKIGAEAVRRADPEAKVVLGGIAYKPDFIKELFQYHGLSPYIDIVNIHNYYETWHRHPVESISLYINEVAEIIWRYGDNQALWMAEVGYSTFRKGSKVSSSYSAYYDYEHTPDYQAIDLFKRLTLILATEKLSAVTWYELKDLPAREDVIGDEYNNRYLGVAFEDYSPKPAAAALQFFNKLFSDEVRSLDSDIEFTSVAGSDAFVHGFETKAGDVILVSWLQTVTPGDRKKNKNGMVKDNRSENIAVLINKELNGSVQHFDQLGNELPVPDIKQNDDFIKIPQLALKGGGLSVIKIKK